MNHSKIQFSWTDIISHWVIATTIFGLFGLGYWMVDLGYYDSWYVTAPDLHRSIGICLLAVMIFSVLWRLTHARAEPLESHTYLERILGHIMHFLLTFTIFLIIVSGYLISTANGRGIEVFQMFEVPGFGSFIENQEDFAGLIHKVTAYGMMGLVLLHFLAAVKHHLIDKDETLTRMLVRRR